ncbi:MAG TPA: TlyA family RNA methyltransferase [Rhizomicrobium sp.]
MRADVFLVERGFAASRSEAQSAIAAGSVSADGISLVRPSQLLAPGVDIVYAKAHDGVSRGSVKLAAALDTFALSPAGRICLDLGASTGGFTQILLERGARKVYAIDVGQGQLHVSLRKDARVVSREKCNARHLARQDVPDPVTALVADVSFISLKLALPPALALAEPGAWLVALVKPQFEVGRGNVGSGGIVRDAQARKEALDSIAQWLPLQGWQVGGTMESPIAGGSGNREYLLAASKT